MKKNNKKIKIVVAMSGGVDSSVAAVLLKRSGFDVIGVFMKFWKDGKSSKNRCCSIESEKLARLVAKQIDIPFYVLNVEREFKNKVVDYFLKEYKTGKTPNPCVVCNKEIKFGLLIDKALKMGADFVATGHYAKMESQPSHSKKLLHRLFKGKDKKKDQSYFLWQISQKQIKHILFPVGNYTKPQVRVLAKKFKLAVLEIPESQEVCFIENSTNDFLKKYLKTKSGDIINKKGDILGKHQGLWFYTIGQRKGLSLLAQAGISHGQGPYYVVSKDFQKNILVVSLGRSPTGEPKTPKDLLSKELIAKDVNWISPKKLPINAEVKIRYKSSLVKAKISTYKRNQVRIIFDKSQQAITPGQSVVFYLGQELLGGGIIE